MDIRIVAGMVVLVPLVAALYLVPTFVAMKRSHHQAAPIFVLNLFFGWMVFPWVLLLAWSVSHVLPRPDAGTAG